MAARSVQLVSPLSRVECVQRLRAAVATSWNLILGGRAGARAVGRVGEHAVRLRKRIRYGNAWQTCLSAQIQEHGGGTRIHCRFGVHPAVRIFMWVWFGFVSLIGGSIFAISLYRLATGRDIGELVSDTTNLIGLVAPTALLAFGAALVAFGRYLARDERQFLLHFLRDTIDAREA